MTLPEFVFSYIDTRARARARDFETLYVRAFRNMASKYRRYRYILKLIDFFFSSRQRAKKMDILFMGTRFIELISEASRYFNVSVLVTGRQDRLALIKRRINYISASKWVNDIYQAYKEQSPEIKELMLRNILSGIKKALLRWSPQIVVLSNDSLFLERAVVRAANEAGIPTVTIHHGLPTISGNPEILDGHYSDNFCVWGEVFKNLLVSKCILPSERVHVLGYPFMLEQKGIVHQGTTSDALLSVCFLGQPWEEYNQSYLHVKTELIESLLRACKETNLQLFYRPHPVEDRKRLAAIGGDIVLTPRAQKLEQAISEYDVFFSFTSTALIEAALRGKLCAQILVEGLPADNLEKLGACYTIDFSDKSIEKFLRKALSGEIRAMPVNPEYIYIPENLGNAFLGILGKITGETSNRSQ